MSELPPEILEQNDRMLSNPLAFPGEFGSWMLDWLSVNIDLALLDLPGAQGIFFRSAEQVDADESTASTSMTDLATVGPTLTGLGNGRYLAFWGAWLHTGGSDSSALMGMFGPGYAGEDESAKGRATTGSDAIPIQHARVFDLTHDDNNWLTAKYMRVAGDSPGFQFRWLHAIKVGNA